MAVIDALHVGCALVVTAHLPEVQIEFWTADKQQAAEEVRPPGRAPREYERFLKNP